MRTEKPTQVRRPWRAVFRTTVIAGVALIPVIPDIVDAAGIEDLPGVAGVLAVAAATQRVLSLPAVESWLQDWLPWLAADSYTGRHRRKKELE